MALELLTELVADAVDDAAKRHGERWSATKRDLAEWVREAATPPAGVELHTADGSSFTGLVLVERNELVMLLAVRHPPGPTSPTPTASSRELPRRNHTPAQFAVPDPNDGRWDRDGDPFRS